MKYASLGSVSSGTMRDKDLLAAFAFELAYQMKRQATRFPRRAYRKLINDAKRRLRLMEKQGSPIEYDAGSLVSDMFEALNDFAPPYAYFGSVEGDGADFGYWMTSDLDECFDGLKVSDTSEVPYGYRGEVLHVNDHGNCTLYVAGGRGKLREIWAVV